MLNTVFMNHTQIFKSHSEDVLELFNEIDFVLVCQYLRTLYE